MFQEGGKVDGDLVLALETLLFGEAELAPPGPDQGDVDGPAEHLHVDGDPGHVLAAQQPRASLTISVVWLISLLFLSKP